MLSVRTAKHDRVVAPPITFTVHRGSSIAPQVPVFHTGDALPYFLDRPTGELPPAADSDSDRLDPNTARSPAPSSPGCSSRSMSRHNCSNLGKSDSRTIFTVFIVDPAGRRIGLACSVRRGIVGQGAESVLTLLSTVFASTHWKGAGN
jgi:hypothetical protein